MTDIPTTAIEAAAVAIREYELLGDEMGAYVYTTAARAAIEAAMPAIREALAQELDTYPALAHAARIVRGGAA